MHGGARPSVATSCLRALEPEWPGGRVEHAQPEHEVEITLGGVPIVDPQALPSARAAWRLLQGARQAAYEEPWSHAVLRALELDEYQALPAHEPGWIARRLGISEALERRSLDDLLGSGQAQPSGGRYVPTGALRRRSAGQPLAAPSPTPPASRPCHHRSRHVYSDGVSHGTARVSRRRGDGPAERQTVETLGGARRPAVPAGTLGQRLGEVRERLSDEAPE